MKVYKVLATICYGSEALTITKSRIIADAMEFLKRSLEIIYNLKNLLSNKYKKI